MSAMRIAVRKDPAHYLPGEEITGAAQWQLDRAPKAVEVRLVWHTTGRGIEDVCCVETVRFDAPLVEERRPFRFTAPSAPYSLNGKLIKIDWTLELVALPSNENTSTDLTIGPGGEPVRLSEQE